MTDEQDLAAYLSSKQVQVFRAHGAEVTTHCFFCPDGDPKGKGKLYLNTESWLYDCKRCAVSGNRKTLLEHFGDTDDLAYVPGTDPVTRQKILTEAALLAHQMLLSNDQALEFLLSRGLSPETIEAKKYGYVPQNVGLSNMIPCRQGENRATMRDLVNAGIVTIGGSEFFNDEILIPYWSHGAVVQLRGKKMNGKYRTPAGDRTRVYNIDSLRGAEDVFITEGEFDADMVEQALAESGLPTLMSTAVVGLPGAGSWPDGFVDLFAKARRVFIGLDPDDTGKTYAKKLADEIGSKARVLKLPEQLPKCDWSDYLNVRSEKNPHGGHHWQDIRDMMTDADLAGKRMFSVSDAHSKWLAQRVSTPGIKFGWTSLDAVLRPGMKPGQIMIPLAKTGTGKSVFLSNLAHNLASRRLLYISLELTSEEVFEHLRRIHRFWFPKATDDERDLFYANLRIVDQNRIARGDLKEYIREFTELVGAPPEMVIVDYLQYFARGFAGGSTYEKVSDATMELKAVAKEESVAIICPSQVNRGAEDGKPLTADDARDSGVIEETGDFVMSLFRPDQVVDRHDATGQLPVQTGALNAQLLKSRHGGKGRLFNFRFSLMSLVIVDAHDRKAVLRVEQENTLYRAGTHYDDYRRDQAEVASQDALI